MRLRDAGEARVAQSKMAANRLHCSGNSRKVLIARLKKKFACAISTAEQKKVAAIGDGDGGGDGGRFCARFDLESAGFCGFHYYARSGADDDEMSDFALRVLCARALSNESPPLNLQPAKVRNARRPTTRAAAAHFTCGGVRGDGDKKRRLSRRRHK